MYPVHTNFVYKFNNEYHIEPTTNAVKTAEKIIRESNIEDVFKKDASLLRQESNFKQLLRDKVSHNLVANSSQLESTSLYWYIKDWEEFGQLAFLLYKLWNEHLTCINTKKYLQKSKIPAGSKVFFPPKCGISAKSIKTASTKNSWTSVSDPTQADYFVLRLKDLRLLHKTSAVYPGHEMSTRTGQMIKARWKVVNPTQYIAQILANDRGHKYTHFNPGLKVDSEPVYIPFMIDDPAGIVVNLNFYNGVISRKVPKVTFRTGVLIPNRDSVVELYKNLHAVQDRVKSGDIKFIIEEESGIETGITVKNSEIEFTRELESNLYAIFTSGTSADTELGVKIFASLEPTLEVALHFALCFVAGDVHAPGLELNGIKQLLKARGIKWKASPQEFLQSVCKNPEARHYYMFTNQHFKRFVYIRTNAILESMSGLDEKTLTDLGLIKTFF